MISTEFPSAQCGIFLFVFPMSKNAKGTKISDPSHLTSWHHSLWVPTIMVYYSKGVARLTLLIGQKKHHLCVTMNHF